jgi:hypothetical protein
MLRSGKVETVKVHHPGPGRHVVLDELLLRIHASVDLGQSPILRLIGVSFFSYLSSSPASFQSNTSTLLRLFPDARSACTTRGTVMVASEKTCTLDASRFTLPQDTASTKVKPERPS